MIWSPTVNSGLRLVIGSWKIIAISRPANGAHALLRQRREVDDAAVAHPVEHAAADDAAGMGEQPHDR